MMSTTRIAISHNVEPRDRKLLKQNILTRTIYSMYRRGEVGKGIGFPGIVNVGVVRTD